MVLVKQRLMKAIQCQTRGHIDRTTFEQILEMDEEDDRDFSRAIIQEFLQQATTTMEKMEKLMYDFRISRR